jgi:hypothetical protein
MVAGCRTSGTQIAASAGIVHSGKCKLISIHMTNMQRGHATNNNANAHQSKFTVYDNTAGSGTTVAMFMLGAGQSLEQDYHGAQMANGLFVAVDNDPHGLGGTEVGVGAITVNFA